jgi:hypothetical protein
MVSDNEVADDLISGHSKRSRSYHSELGQKPYGEIKRLASQSGPDRKAARQMKKLIENDPRLKGNAKRPRH